MATEASQPLKITLQAASDLSSYQYHFIKMDSAGKATPVTATTDAPIGVLQNNPSNTNEGCEVVVVGVTKLSADAAVNIGAYIGVSADGQATMKTAGTDTTGYLAGVALDTASTASIIFTGLVNCPGGRGA